MSIAKTVERFISSRPFALESLRKGLTNDSALARYVISEQGLRPKDFHAVLVALRRFTDKARPTKALEKQILGLLTDARIRVLNRMCVLVFSQRISLRELNKPILQILEREEPLHVVRGTKAFTIITTDNNYDYFVKNFKPFIVFSRRGLAEISVETSAEIAETPGVVAFLYTRLAERGINMVETLSSYTDTIIIVEDKDVQKAMTALTL